MHCVCERLNEIGRITHIIDSMIRCIIKNTCSNCESSSSTCITTVTMSNRNLLKCRKQFCIAYHNYVLMIRAIYYIYFVVVDVIVVVHVGVVVVVIYQRMYVNNDEMICLYELFCRWHWAEEWAHIDSVAILVEGISLASNWPSIK